MISLPQVPALSEPPEPYAPSTKPIGCDPVAKPGVVAFSEWVMSLLGGSNGGITRGCTIGRPSYHHIGSAWDWMVDAFSADDRVRADQLIEWLLSPDPDGNEHAMARRSGLVYMIWDGSIWGTWNRGWSPYGGENPHTDHVHFSFSEDGAAGRTSFFRWIGLPQSWEVNVEQTATQEPGSSPDSLSLLPIASGLVAFSAGLAASYYGPRIARHSRSRW
jgi:hypothetical protein